MSNVHPPGMCKDCRVAPAPVNPDGSLASRCDACRLARNELAAAERARRRRRRLCQRTGCTSRVVTGRTYCQEHLDYYAARQRARYQASAQARAPNARKPRGKPGANSSKSSNS